MPDPTRDMHEVAVSFFVMVTAVCALGLSWYQIEISRTHNKLSTKPFIDLYTQTSTLKERADPEYQEGIFIGNKGLGPARITRITYYVNKVEFADSADNSALGKIGTLLKTEQTIGDYETDELEAGDYIKADDEMGLLVVKPKDVTDDKKWLEFLNTRLRYVVNYCSVYGECETICYPRSSPEPCR